MLICVSTMLIFICTTFSMNCNNLIDIHISNNIYIYVPWWQTKHLLCSKWLPPAKLLNLFSWIYIKPNVSLLILYVNMSIIIRWKFKTKIYVIIGSVYKLTRPYEYIYMYIYVCVCVCVCVRVYVRVFCFFVECVNLFIKHANLWFLM